MTYLTVVIVAVLLFTGFLVVTAYESRRGSRFFARARYRIDTKVARMLFVVEHVDWGAFSAHLTRTTVTTLAHDIAHGSLVAVRAAERFLTRAVRALRSHRDNAATLPAPVQSAEVLEAVLESKEEVREVESLKEQVKEVEKLSVETVTVIEVSEEPVPASAPESVPAPEAPKPARKRAPRNMDIPRRTKSKVRDIVQGPEEDTPV